LPHTSSGLSLLVRRHLTTHLDSQPIPEAARQLLYKLAFDHHAVRFNVAQGADAMANKGFTLDTVHIGADPNDFIYIVNTHAQANDPGAVDPAAVRASQLQQIRSLIDANTDPRYPVLLLGDFNVKEATDADNDGVIDIDESLSGVDVDGDSKLDARETTDEYLAMLGTLGLTPIDDLFRNYYGAQSFAYGSDGMRNAYARNWFNPDERQRLDYMLVRQGTEYRIGLDFILMHDNPITTQLCQNSGWVPDPAAPGLRCYLSDHFGVEADLRLQRALPA
jgi:hypothetical protein